MACTCILISIMIMFLGDISMVLTNSKLSLADNLFKSLFNLKKDKIESFIKNPVTISKTVPVSFNQKKIKAYQDFVAWNIDEIHPIFPYALITHIQFSLVNDKNFPFSPFGLVHKKETIECFKPLVNGKWTVKMYLDEVREVEKGYELISITELTIDGELFWKSTTTAFKKTKRGPSKIRPNKEKVESNIIWDIPDGHGRKYGMISHNIDPIHMSRASAKLMGFKKGALMHGMWTVARSVSEYSKLTYPFKLDVKFISPVYMPTKVLFSEKENSFGVYSESGERVHLLGEFK